jgi:hypothetical protein
MRIQFKDKREAARFAAAVVNVTGREPVLTRAESAAWHVQSADLNREWAFAISSLLQSGVPSQQVTLNEVATRVDAERWTAREGMLTPGQLTALRGMRLEALTAAVS